jgi:hypothetical protein
MLISQMMVLLFIGASLIVIVSTLDNAYSKKKITFADAFYYMIVTSSTIGYGDIYPTTATTRFLIIFLIMISFVIFGENVSKLAQLI